MVTHDQEEALSLADRVAIMLDGRIVQVDPPAQLYNAPTTREVASFIGDAQFVRGVADGERAQTPLGPVWLYTPVSGDVDVLVRPELIELLDAESSDGFATGRIVDLTFFGHDQLATVACSIPANRFRHGGSAGNGGGSAIGCPSASTAPPKRSRCRAQEEPPAADRLLAVLEVVAYASRSRALMRPCM